MRSRGRLASVLAAMAMATVLGMPAAAGALGGAGDAAATGGVEVVRYAGSDPYEQSLVIARATVAAKGGASEWAVLASGESWTHAAVAGPLAASLDAPVLLMPPGYLQSPTEHLDIASFLESARITRAVAVGDLGPAPMRKPSRHFGSGMLPPSVEHVWGDGPAALSVAAARRLGTPAAFGDRGRTVIIASDRGVADAVAVGPLAAAGPFPLLLTAPDTLDPRTTEYLSEHEFDHVVLVGGTAAIAPAVQQTIEAAGAKVTRLAGRDRADTARLAAELFALHTEDDPACADGPTRIGLAPARHPEQALTAGPLLARTCTPLRYTGPERLPADLHNTIYLAWQQPRDVELRVFAEENAIADTALHVSLPPLQLAFVSISDASEGGDRHAQIALVDERGEIRMFPQTKTEVPAWASLDAYGWCRLRDLAWSPTGRLLSYRHLCTGEIFVLDTETGESYQVVSADSELILEDDGSHDGLWGAGPLEGSWSPDGRALVFTAFVGDPATVGTWQGNPVRFAELFVHDTESRTTRRLTKNTAHDLVGSWSPDGEILTALQHWDPRVFDRYYRSVRSYAFTRVSETETAPQSATCGIGPSAIWSPDGSRLAYHLDNGWWTNQVAVCTVGSAGHRQLTPVDCSDCSEGHQHSGARILGWNHSGSLFAFSDIDYSQEDGEFDFESETTADYVLDMESGEISKLFEFTHETHDWPPLFYLEWSRNGDGILYLRLGEDASEARDLVSLNHSTGNITTLREIPLLRPDQEWPFHSRWFLYPVQPRLRFSPDQSQLLLVYDGPWPGHDGGMRLASVTPGELTPLIDFGPIISLAAVDDAANVPTWRRFEWRCTADWTAVGILSTCRHEY